MIQDFLTGVDRVLGHRPKLVHFTSLGDASGEDEINTEVLAAMCQEAGYTVNKLWLDHIGLGKDGRFYHIEGYHIDIIFKPYPWELMMMEKFDKSCFADMDNVGKRDARASTLAVLSG